MTETFASLPGLELVCSHWASRKPHSGVQQGWVRVQRELVPNSLCTRTVLVWAGGLWAPVPTWRTVGRLGTFLLGQAVAVCHRGTMCLSVGLGQSSMGVLIPLEMWLS